MAFCTTCGRAVSGRFCETCGVAVGTAAAPAAAPVPIAAAVPRKTSPIVWILLGLGVMVVLFIGAITVGGIFVVHKARQAGLDPALWQRNPGVAVTKMLAAANPDAEIVSLDERGGIVVVRDRKSGKTIRMNFADIKQGRMSFDSEDGRVSLAAAADGSIQLPAWLPAYSGAHDAGGISASGANGDSGTYGFQTADAPAAVISFYEAALKKAGFEIQQRIESGVATILTAESANTAVNLAAAPADGHTSVTLTFSPKTKP
jgi:hypothetical protein